MNETDDAMRIDLSWSGGLLFKAQTDGVALQLDGDSENGFSPCRLFWLRYVLAWELMSL